MAVDMFLQLDGIKGESKDHKYRDHIDILSWSWGMSQSGSSHVGSGSGTGKVSIQDIAFTKYIDKSTAALLLHCANGKHIKKAKVIMRKAGDKPLEYLTVELEDLIVSNVQTGGSHGDDRITEHVTFNFAKMKVEYQEQLANGSGGPKTEMKWDIPAGQTA